MESYQLTCTSVTCKQSPYRHVHSHGGCDGSQAWHLKGHSRRIGGEWAQYCNPMTGDSAISRITKIVWPWLLVLNCWGSLQSWSLGPAVIPSTWLILVVPAFLVLSHLYSSKIYQSLGVIKLRGVIQPMPQKVGEAGHPSYSPFPDVGNFIWGVPSWYWAVLAWMMGCTENMKLFFLLLSCNYSQFFCSIV